MSSNPRYFALFKKIAVKESNSGVRRYAMSSQLAVYVLAQ